MTNTRTTKRYTPPKPKQHGNSMSKLRPPEKMGDNYWHSIKKGDNGWYLDDHIESFKGGIVWDDHSEDRARLGIDVPAEEQPKHEHVCSFPKNNEAFECLVPSCGACWDYQDGAWKRIVRSRLKKILQAREQEIADRAARGHQKMADMFPNFQPVGQIARILTVYDKDELVLTRISEQGTIWDAHIAVVALTQGEMDFVNNWFKNDMNVAHEKRLKDAKAKTLGLLRYDAQRGYSRDEDRYGQEYYFKDDKDLMEKFYHEAIEEVSGISEVSRGNIGN